MQPTRGGCMATHAAAICLEILRAGEAERLESDARRVYLAILVLTR